MVGLGRFFFRYRNGLGPLVFVLALALGRPGYVLGRADLDGVLDLLGILVALLGEALRILTIGYDYIERGGRGRQVHASRLVQGGVFAHCRNPLYLGNIMLALGISLVVNSPAFYLLVLPAVILAYAAIVAAEEAFLREKFGRAYLRYCRRVQRWVPRWRGWTYSVGNMRFNWGRVLAKEYNTMFSLVIVLAGVKLWADYVMGGAAALPAPRWLAAAFAAWLLAYLTVRALKKRGRLDA